MTMVTHWPANLLCWATPEAFSLSINACAYSELEQSGAERLTNYILIVDDEPAVLRVLSYMLAHGGYQTIGVESAEEGLTAIKQRSPILIICDLMMPDISGLDFIQLVRSNPETASVPIISVSASVERDLIERSLILGSFSHLAKPFSQSKLIEMVELALQDQP